MACLLLVCRSALAMVFLVSFGSKVRGRDAIDAFEDWFSRLPLPFARHRITARALLVFELGTAILLATPDTGPAGLVAAAGLVLTLTVGVALLLREEGQHSCQCFGKEPTTLRVRHLVRNLSLLAISVLGLAAGLPRTAAPTAGQAAGSVFAGLVSALFFIFFDDFVDLLPGARLEALPSEDYR